MPKYNNNETDILNSNQYFDIFEIRGLKYAKIKRTKTFEGLHNLELEIRTEHVWSYGDTLLKISRQYYGTDKLWPTIAIVNKKPTDGHYNIGDVVLIVDQPGIIEGVL